MFNLQFALDYQDPNYLQAIALVVFQLERVSSYN